MVAVIMLKSPDLMMLADFIPISSRLSVHNVFKV